MIFLLAINYSLFLEYLREELRTVEGYGDIIGKSDAMRRVYALLGLVRKYGAARVEAACSTALAAEMLSVPRLKAMLAHAAPAPAVSPPAFAPPARYLRPALQYALRLAPAPLVEVGHGQ